MHRQIRETQVEFGQQGDRVRATLVSPEVEGRRPAVVMGHGWGMVADGTLLDFARALVRTGLVVLAFDYRRLGRSEGHPRQDLDPYAQIEDFRDALTYLSGRPEVDPDRLGVWGTSYGGGHVLVLSATDYRVRCAVAQVPSISGSRAAAQRLDADKIAQQRQLFHAARAEALAGAGLTMVSTVTGGEHEFVTYPDEESRAYMAGQGAICPTWRNETTLRSVEKARWYEPGCYADQIRPPLLMVVAAGDRVTPTNLQREAYARIPEPKGWVEVPGGHYVVYDTFFQEAATAAADWFHRWLAQ